MPLNVSAQSSIGFVGYVQTTIGGAINIVRATSADIKLSQEINKPEVITGRFDRILYWPGPRIVEGSVEFPAVDIADFGNITTRVWNAAVKRTLGSLDEFDVEIRYTNGVSFKYPKCIANEFTFSVAQQDLINIRFGVIGTDRQPGTLGPAPSVSGSGGVAGSVTNARVLTWADVDIDIQITGNSNAIVGGAGKHLRNFEATINNNAERVYALNGELAPIFIVPKVRDITGNFTTLGRFDQVSEHAASNQDRCSEDSVITFGYKSCGQAVAFTADIVGVVFEIEEMAITNDIFETTVNYHGLPDESDLVQGL